MTSSFQPHSTRIRMSSGRSDRVAGRMRSIVDGGVGGDGGGVGVGEVGMRCCTGGREVKASAELGQTWTTLSSLDMGDRPIQVLAVLRLVYASSVWIQVGWRAVERSRRDRVDDSFSPLLGSALARSVRRPPTTMDYDRRRVRR
jgi:hypothetical protein